jgi:predicted permease
VAIFLEVFITIVFPVFVLIGFGVLMDRLFTIDVQTLSKFNFYLLLPALLFVAILKSDLDPTMFGTIVGFTVVHHIVMLAAGWGIFSVARFRQRRPVLVLGSMYYNAGNYGLPLVGLAFGPQALSVAAIILMTQNLFGFMVGLWLIGDEGQSWRDVLRNFLAVPSLYTIAAALLMSAFNFQLPKPLAVPIEHLADALIPMALLMLGVQLSRGRITGRFADVAAVSVVRLIGSPLVAMGLVALWAALISPGILIFAPVLVVVAAVPVAVTVYVLSIEYERNPNLASQMIFWSTLLSAFTVTGWLILYQ